MKRQEQPSAQKNPTRDQILARVLKKQWETQNNEKIKLRLDRQRPENDTKPLLLKKITCEGRIRQNFGG